MSKKYILSLAMMGSLSLMSPSLRATIDPDLHSLIIEKYKLVDKKFKEIEADVAANPTSTAQKIAQGAYDTDSIKFSLVTRAGTLVSDAGYNHTHPAVNFGNLQVSDGTQNIGQFLQNTTADHTISMLIEKGNFYGEPAQTSLSAKRTKDGNHIMVARAKTSVKVIFPKVSAEVHDALSKTK